MTNRQNKIIVYNKNFLLLTLFDKYREQLKNFILINYVIQINLEHLYEIKILCTDIQKIRVDKIIGENALRVIKTIN